LAALLHWVPPNIMGHISRDPTVTLRFPSFSPSLSLSLLGIDDEHVINKFLSKRYIVPLSKPNETFLSSKY
jgi:hypothetical protein